MTFKTTKCVTSYLLIATCQPVISTIGKPMATVLVQEPSRKTEERHSYGPRSGEVSYTYLLSDTGYQGLSKTRQVFPWLREVANVTSVSNFQ